MYIYPIRYLIFAVVSPSLLPPCCCTGTTCDEIFAEACGKFTAGFSRRTATRSAVAMDHGRAQEIPGGFKGNQWWSCGDLGECCGQWISMDSIGELTKGQQFVNDIGELSMDVFLDVKMVNK